MIIIDISVERIYLKKQIVKNIVLGRGRYHSQQLDAEEE